MIIILIMIIILVMIIIIAYELSAYKLHLKRFNTSFASFFLDFFSPLKEIAFFNYSQYL